jgi:hypothetical protein
MMKIRFAALMFPAIFVLCGASALAQSTNRESPTPISGTTVYSGSVRDTNREGSTAYYYSVNVERGTVHATLRFTPPSTGASMSILFSGRDCCPPDSGLGGDSGGGTAVTSESTFAVPSTQTLLLEVYVDAGAGGEVSFTLQIEGSVGGTGDAPVCSDLSVTIAKAQSVKVCTKQIRVDIFGTIANDSANDFVSGAGQQSLKIFQSSPALSVWGVVFTQPFTSVRAGGRVPFLFNKTFSTADFTRLRPSFKVEIVYDGAIATDGNPRNDDCAAANNLRSIPFETIKSPR